MKNRIFYISFIALMWAGSISALDLTSLLKGVTSGTGSGSSASDIVNSIVNSITSTSVKYNDLIGSWSYSAPAVSFSSGNFVQDAGGVAASSAIVAKLKPYYTKAGVQNLKIEFGADSTFVAQINKLKVQGTVHVIDKDTFKFNFKAFGKVSTGSINAFIEKNSSGINITFDAKKLLKLAETIASISGNATLQKASKLVNSYEGVNIGVALKKN